MTRVGQQGRTTPQPTTAHIHANMQLWMDAAQAQQAGAGHGYIHSLEDFIHQCEGSVSASLIVGVLPGLFSCSAVKVRQR